MRSNPFDHPRRPTWRDKYLRPVVILALAFIIGTLAWAAISQENNINCGQDIDQAINNDSKSTGTLFVIEDGCTFLASSQLKPSNNDEIECAAAPTFIQRGPAYDPSTKCHIAGSPGLDTVIKPIGPGGSLAHIRMEGVKITGGYFAQAKANGSGAALALGSTTDDSTFYGLEIRDNASAGILSARGTFERIEFTNNTTNSTALGFNAAAMKSRHEVEVKDSYIHDTQGNGLWCDNSCVDTSHDKFFIHDNLVVNVGRAGIRWEEIPSDGGEARIEDNLLAANSYDAKRGAVSVRDAKGADIVSNTFGPQSIAGTSYRGNANKLAISATDSGRSDRPNLSNIAIANNDLNGEIIKGCGGPVTCSGN